MKKTSLENQFNEYKIIRDLLPFQFKIFVSYTFFFWEELF